MPGREGFYVSLKLPPLTKVDALLALGCMT